MNRDENKQLRMEHNKYREALERIANDVDYVNYTPEMVCDTGNYDDAFEMGIRQGAWYAAEIALEALGLPVPTSTDE